MPVQTMVSMWKVITPAQYAHWNVVAPIHSSVLCAADVYALMSGEPMPDVQPLFGEMPR